MPTYNGSTITTGTLYEDGTIRVKNGFTTKIDSMMVRTPQIGDFKKKMKIIDKTGESILGTPEHYSVTVGPPTIGGFKKKVKIIDHSTQNVMGPDPTNYSVVVGAPTISGFRKKTVIIEA